MSIVDEHTRECLGGLVERCITGDDLIDELDGLAQLRGYPAVLRCDDGLELACAAMFNSRICDECNINIFWSLAQARVVISD